MEGYVQYDTIYIKFKKHAKQYHTSLRTSHYVVNL